MDSIIIIINLFLTGIDVSHIAIANSKSTPCVYCSQMHYTFVFRTCLSLSYVTLNVFFVTGR